MPPFNKDAINDDFQDARVLEIRDDYIEIEVIHYPFVDISESMQGNYDWRQDYANIKEYLKPGLTTNWDDKMRDDLLAELKSDGIIIDRLTDKQVVEQVSSWLMKKSRALDKVFTTYYVHFSDEKAIVYPGLERKVSVTFVIKKVFPEHIVRYDPVEPSGSKVTLKLSDGKTLTLHVTESVEEIKYFKERCRELDKVAERSKK